MRILPIGVYNVRTSQPCYLIELQVLDAESPLDLSKITQKQADAPRDNWQVPYKECLLDPSGTKILSEEWEMLSQSQLTGDFRIAFFFHYLRPNDPLETEIGEIYLPPASEMPSRLKEVKYTEPD